MLVHCFNGPLIKCCIRAISAINCKSRLLCHRFRFPQSHFNTHNVIMLSIEIPPRVISVLTEHIYDVIQHQIFFLSITDVHSKKCNHGLEDQCTSANTESQCIKIQQQIDLAPFNFVYNRRFYTDLYSSKRDLIRKMCFSCDRSLYILIEQK